MSYLLSQIGTEDSDNDGVIDDEDNCPIIVNPGQWDKDNDGLGHECDPDIDGDGAPNLLETFSNTSAWDKNSVPSNGDIDNDGVDDFSDNCFDVANVGQWDNDLDEIGNLCDDDVDGDGVLNVLETAMGTDVWGPYSFPAGDDFDKDSISNSIDNCPLIANQSQGDRDNDSIGNDCDDDIDGDGFSNHTEKLAGTKAWDSRSISELSGLDVDNDLIDDDIDNCLNIANTGQWDKDTDGLGNECDDDIDGDGVSNDDEKLAGTNPWDATSF